MIDFLSKAEEQRLVDAIGRAEQNTSGEIRVHLEANCKGNPYERAIEVFYMLEMNKTAARNGVLIYVAFSDRKLAILGDVGIHMHVAPETWETIKNQMTADFSTGNYAAGLCTAVASVGEHLKNFFPYHRDDRNELSNSVSTNPFK